MREVEKLRSLATERQMHVVDNGLSGPQMQCRILGGRRPISYWPLSRRRTAYIESSGVTVRHVTPEEAIALTLCEKDE